MNPRAVIDEANSPEPRNDDLGTAWETFRSATELLKEVMLRERVSELEEESILALARVTFSIARSAIGLPGREQPSGDHLAWLTVIMTAPDGMAFLAVMTLTVLCGYARVGRCALPVDDVRLAKVVGDGLALLEDGLRSGSIVVLSAIALWFQQLFLVDKAWAFGHIAEVFLDDTVRWEAAWTAYLCCESLYYEACRALIPVYERAVKEIADCGSSAEPAWAGRLADHLAVLVDAEELPSDTGLVARFLQVSSDSARSQIVLWFSNRLEDAQQDTDKHEAVWQRALAYWQQRAQTAPDTSQGDGSHEMASFARVLQLMPAAADLDELLPVLSATCRLGDPRSLELHLFEFLLARAASAPGFVITVLREAWAGAQKHSYGGMRWSYRASGGAREVLEAIRDAGDPSACDRARDLADVLMREDLGYREFLRQLPKASGGTPVDS